MQRSTPILSYAFLFALGVLLLNDNYLKAAAPGLVTGKLSDFAGLFAFPLFWTALKPRNRATIHWATAAGFTWWKLPLSQPVIDLWNAWAPVSVGRTVDATDLVALTAVLLSYWYSGRTQRREVRASELRFAIVPMALFAFAATTVISVQSYERTYLFRTSPVELRQSLGALGIEEWAPADSMLPPAPVDGVGELRVRIPTDCCGAVVALLHVGPDSVGTAATIRGLRVGGALAQGDSIRLIELFERCFVQRMDSLLTSGRAMRDVSISYPAGVPQPATWCQR